MTNLIGGPQWRSAHFLRGIEMLFLKVMIINLVMQCANAESRPWCLDGVGLCRGKVSASEQFSHTMTIFPGISGSRPKAVILGGQRGIAASSFISLNTITTIDLTDTTLMTQTKVPFDIGNASRPQRSGHSAVAYNNSVLVFGGTTINRTESKSPVSTNEVLWLDPGDVDSSPMWRVLFNRTRVSAGSSTAPVPRQNAAAAVSGNALWIFGGTDNNTQLLNDTWSFNLTTRTWKQHLPAETGSVPRNGNTTGLQKAVMVATSDSKYLLLYGGRSNNVSTGLGSQNRLWAFEMASGNWKQINMGLPDEQNPVCNDATLLLLTTNLTDSAGQIQVSAGHELLVASTGFWKPSSTSNPSSYKMWVNVMSSNTNGNFQQKLTEAFFNNSTSIPFTPRIFISNKTKNVLQVDENSTSIGLPGFSEVLPLPDRFVPVKDTALGLNMYGLTRQQVLIYGGQDLNGKASSKFLVIDLNLKSFIDTSTKLKPGLLGTDQVMRYATHMVAPKCLDCGLSGSNMAELLIYTGADNLNDDDEPVLTEFVVVDVTKQNVLPRCSSKNQAQAACKVLPVPREYETIALPGSRDGLAFTSIHQVFMRSNASTPASQQPVGGRLLLMYGGMQLVGSSVNDATTSSSSSDSSLTKSEKSLRDVLSECDSQGTLDSIQLNEIAQCSVPQLEAIEFCGHSSAGGMHTASPPMENWYSNGDYNTDPPDFVAASPLGLYGTPPSPPAAPSRRLMAAKVEGDENQDKEEGDQLLYSSPYDISDQFFGGDEALEAFHSIQRHQWRKEVVGEELQLGSGYTSGTHRGRELEVQRGKRNLIAESDSGNGGSGDGADTVEAARAWGSRAIAAPSSTSAASVQGPSRKASKGSRLYDITSSQTDVSMPTVYGTAYAVLWYSTDDGMLVNQDVMYLQEGSTMPTIASKGPAFYYDILRNVNGSLRHAPGERAAASLANLPYIGPNNTDAILFGGLTAFDKNASNDMLGVPRVTNDVYYLQYIPATPGQMFPDANSLPPGRFPSCPFISAEGEPLCKSVAVFPQEGDDMGDKENSQPPSDETLLEDCPAELRRLESGETGTYQLRIYRSINKAIARSMSIMFWSVSLRQTIYAYISGGEVANGPCCAGNNTRWAWPPNVTNALVPPTQRNTISPADSSSNTADNYWFYLPNGMYEIFLISNGSGWTTPVDLLPPFNCSADSTEHCPRMELYNYESNRNIRWIEGLGQHATWIAAENTTVDYSRSFRLSLCGSTFPPPLMTPSTPPPEAPTQLGASTTPPPEQPEPNPYPFMVEGQPNLLRSYELQLAPDHGTDDVSMPQGRMWHASCFVETKNLPGALGFGKMGLLAVHGGVKNHNMKDIDIDTDLLDDMWVFDLEYRRWIQMPGYGCNPGKRLRHSMKADGSTIFLSGGVTYDPDRQDWPYDTKVYYIDLQLGVDAVWILIDGDQTELGRRTSPNAITQGMGVSRQRSQLITLNDQGIVFVPTPISTKLEGGNSSNNSIGGNLGNGSTAVVPASVLATAIDQMYDGDLLLIPEDLDITVTGLLSISASVIIHGQVTRQQPSPPSPQLSSQSPELPLSPESPLSPPPEVPIAHRRSTQQQIRTLDSLNDEFNYDLYFVRKDADADADEGSIHQKRSIHYVLESTDSDSLEAEADQQQQQQQKSELEWEVEEEQQQDVAGVEAQAHFSLHRLVDSWSSRRVLLSQSELDAALEGTSAHLTFTSDPEMKRWSQDETREGLEAVRRVLQASSSSRSTAKISSGTPPSDINVTEWLEISRTRVVCSPGGALLLKSASSLVSLEFIGCQVIVSNSSGSNVNIVNCVFRDTVDRPAILIRPGARVVIEGTLFYNNTYVSPTLNSSTITYINGTTNLRPSVGDSYWGAGSAIYVMSRGTIEEMSDTAFVRNGYGPGSSRGGAIYLVGPSACLDTISNCAFLYNGRASANFLGGGAIYGDGVDGCDLTMANTNFSGNVGGDGGGVYLTATGARTMNLNYIKFWNNRALWAGGAMQLMDVRGTVAIIQTEVVNNTATKRGGGLNLDSVATLAVDGLLLDRNSVPLGLGGGLAQSREGVLQMNRSTVSYNQALYGGGMGLSQDVNVQMSDTLITNNIASAHAGGLECYQCYKFTAIRTDITANTAPSGGGLVLTRVELGGELTSVRVYDNVGMPTDGTAYKIDNAGCARDARGGGGGLCIDLQSSVTLRNVSVVNNTAVTGGGAFIQQRCLPGDLSCGPAVLIGSVFVGNTARGGGGGAVFRTTHNLTNVTCPSDESLTPWHGLHTACTSSWLRNTALYGNVTATIAYGLALVSPSRIPSYRSNDPLELLVLVYDYHNQTILDGTREATTSLVVQPALNASVLLAGNSISTIRGWANFTRTLKLQAKPGTYVLNVDAPRTTQDVPSLNLEVTVRPCVYGEVTNKEGTQCYSCDLGTFALNSSKTTCDPCPDNANCSIAGFPWITLPQSGYWHSGPRSPNIIACVYEAACQARKDWSRQDNMINYLKALGNGAMPYNLTAYYDLQCSRGYKGTLCSRCEVGYGQSSSGKCSKCGSRVLSTLWFILSTFINIFFVFITIRAQLPDSLTSCRRLEADQEQQQQQQGEAQQQTMVKKSMQGANVNQQRLPSLAAVETLPPLQMVLPTKTASLSTPASELASSAVTTSSIKAYRPQLQLQGGAAVSDSATIVDRMDQAAVAVAVAVAVAPVADEPDQQQQTPPAVPSQLALQQRQSPQQSGSLRPHKDMISQQADNQVEEGGSTRPQRQSNSQARQLSLISTSTNEAEEDKAVVDEDPTAGPYKGGNHGIVFKILVSYLQVLGLIRSISAPWPSVFAVILSMAKSASNSMTTIVSIDCSLNQGGSLPISIQRVIITIATPFTIMALALTVWLVLFLNHLVKKSPLGASFVKYMQPRVIITLISIVFYVYPDITTTFLSLFSCPIVDPEDGQYAKYMEVKGAYWSRDYNLKCYEKSHLYLVAMLGSPGVVLFAIGAPIFSFVWLRGHRALLFTSPDFGVAYGFMYKDYNRKLYFWDSIIMFRKLVVAAVIVFLQPEGQELQVLAVLGAILLATIAQVTIKPYKNSQMNELERLSLYAIVAILYFTLLILTDIPKAAKYALGMMLTLANIVLVAYFVWKIIQEVGLYIIWSIDDQSNADGKLEWEDVWRYVEVKHTNKYYTPVLVKTLRGLQSVTTFTYSMVSVPYGALSRASSRLRDQVRSHSRNRIQPKDMDGPIAVLPPSSSGNVDGGGSGSGSDGGSSAATDRAAYPPEIVQLVQSFTDAAPEPLPKSRSASGFRQPLERVGSGTGSGTRMSPALRKMSDSGAGSGGVGASTTHVRTLGEPDGTATTAQQYHGSVPSRGAEPQLTSVRSAGMPYISAHVPKRVLTSGSMKSTALPSVAAADNSNTFRVPS